MKIKRIIDLLDEPDKIKFTNELLDTFDKMGLGVLSKADFEAYLYYLLKKHKKREIALGKYDWVRLLKVTPSKLNSMQTLSSVKFENLEDKKAELFEYLVRELSSNPIEIYDLEQQRLQVFISDMHIKLFIESYAAENGYAIRYESNPNELVIQFELFLQLLDEIEEHFKTEFNLREELKGSLKKENQNNELKEALKTNQKFSSFFIEKLGMTAEKQGYAEVVKVIGNTSLQLIMEYLKAQ
ncbi:MAG: Uncharacterised protein [Cryomorphaceae bacterium]|nr:MAG: Uncharacterised protein [Cryomorphaceae bacterium]